MTKREAVEKLLMPYYTGEQEQCIDEGGDCSYHGPNGNTCAFGMACKDLSDLRDGPASDYLENNEDVLKDEYKGMFTYMQWNMIQKAHDMDFQTASIASIEKYIPESKGLFKPRTS